MRRLKAGLILALIGFGMAASLGGCIIEDRGDGGWHHEHHDWR